LSKHLLSEAEILRKLTELVQLNKHASLPADPVELSETEIRRGLNNLAQILAAAAGSAAAYRKKIFTNREREQLRRQSGIHCCAVAELIDALADHPRALVREHRLAKLFEAVGSSAFIASYVVKNPTLDLLRSAAATKGRLDKVREPEVTNIICEEFGIFRKRHPDWKPNTPRRGAHYVAKIIYKPVNNRVTKLIRVKKKTPGLRPDTIARYLRKQYPNLFKSD
jgi:hypothetical protein